MIDNPLRLSLAKSSAKRAGSGVFLVVVVFLMLFPFINTFNELLVKIVEQLSFLEPITNVFVGYEARLVRVFLTFISIQTTGHPSSPIISLVGKTGGVDPVAIAWGCSGWQSLVLVGATLVAGFQGEFTRLSKIEALLVGGIVTFWLNIFRLTFIFYLFYHYGQKQALFFHDYGSVILTIVWLFTFWYYAFNFVLRAKTDEYELMVGKG